MKTEFRLKIADVIIGFRSEYPLEAMDAPERRFLSAGRFDGTAYEGRGRSHIVVDVKVVPRLPRLGRAKLVFKTCHYQDGEENWRLWEKEGGFIFTCSLRERKQLMKVNRSFDRVTAYLLARPRKGRLWDVSSIIYDFLQVLMIVHLAQRREGVFLHAAGIKDSAGRGMIFAGKSTAGKSTTAKRWHREPGAAVLNDDRVIVRKRGGRFRMYGSPWHGDFFDYIASCPETGPVDDMFFIRHAGANAVAPIALEKIIERLYPVTFPAFWDKTCLENILDFCQDMARNVPCFDLGLRKGPSSIAFVRRFMKKKHEPVPMR
jgi:hypothetical protein